MAQIELKRIGKKFKQGTNETVALIDIDLSIDNGEFLSIVGPSGSGKSTLLNIMGCIDKPSSGQFLLNGKDMTNVSEKEVTKYRRNQMAFIFQSYNLIPVLNVKENIEIALQVSESNKTENHKRITKILENVGLGGMASKRPGELSGGQEQRVAIARALIKNSEIIYADEPTANLDSKTAESVMQLMAKMNQELGTTFIFSTHDKLVQSFARRIITIRDGRIISDVRS